MSFLFILFCILLVVICIWPDLITRYFVYNDISNKVVLITGGGSGIGKIMAILFAKKHCKVIIWDIRQNLLDDTLKEIKNLGLTATAYICDISKREIVDETAEKVKKEFKNVDIIINCAGISGLGKSFIDLDPESIVRTFQVNVFGSMWVTKAFLPDMLKRNSGHLVTIDSVMGLGGAAGLSDYVASKFALFGFHETIRLEINKANANIDTTIICPYAIDTGMFKGVNSKNFPYITTTICCRDCSRCCNS